MSESKILKGRCKKTGAQFGMELKEYGGEWKVVNMIKMADAEADSILSEVRQTKFVTHTNLIPCQKCGSRVVGGCACAKTGAVCTKEMKYKFACVYCNEFEINYSRKRTPYTAWAGVSNIPGATKDKFGNPSGSEYDLAQDGAFEGHSILIITEYNEVHLFTNSLKRILQKKGFFVNIQSRIPSPSNLKEMLKTAGQLWVISMQHLHLSSAHLQIIKEYFEAGHGLYVWGDNDPLNDDANYIIQDMFNSRLSGNYQAEKILGIQEGIGAPGIIANHLISTGIISFYEGVTISKVQMSQDLQPLVYSSDRNIVTAYYERDGKRALIDGGFTRLWDGYLEKAGTERYLVNAAAWLANIERFGY